MPAAARVALAAALALGLAAVVLAHQRALWPAVRDLHRFLADHGVPSWVRQFDSFLILAGAALLGAILVARRSRRSALDLLALRAGRPGWPRVVALALAPMILGGLIAGAVRGRFDSPAAAILADFVSSTLRAPLAEELLFRGLLVALPIALLRLRGLARWAVAIPSAALFALAHVPWSGAALSAHWPTLAVTFAGGLWYAWLTWRWRSLGVPIALHAGMNLGWLLASAPGGAAGAWADNALRAATIAIATVLTLRAAGARAAR